MSLYAFNLGQIISIVVLGQVDHDGQHGNAARTPIMRNPGRNVRNWPHPKTATVLDLPNHKSFGYSEALILYGSEMVVLGVVIGKCEMSSTDISQENEHAILKVKRQFVAYKFR